MMHMFGHHLSMQFTDMLSDLTSLSTPLRLTDIVGMAKFSRLTGILFSG